MRANRVAVSLFLVVAACIGAIVTGTGCATPPERLNAPPQGQTDRPNELQDNFVRMNDNALLSERSMSSVHFVPGTNELNTTGVRRLMRYVTLLKVYGGSLAYDGVEEPKEVAEERVDHIQSFLAAAGVGPDNVTVEVALAGGSRMRAAEAGLARDGSTIVNDKAKAWSFQEAQKRVLDYNTEVGDSSK